MQSVSSLLFTGKSEVRARALLLGEHLDLKTLEATDRLALLPLTVRAGERGCAVLFRYGAVVLYDLTPLEEVTFLSQLKPLLNEPFSDPETEEVDLRIADTEGDRVEGNTIRLRSFNVERLQIVADALAKSVVLSYYEASVSDVFDQIEPLADELRRTGRGHYKDRDLLRHIGGILLIQQKMVGMVEVGDKPETLWESPELERLYLRLEDEYELRERHLSLERKLALITRSAETVLNLLQHNSGLRVEWYIVILIVAEMALSLYQMFANK